MCFSHIKMSVNNLNPRKKSIEVSMHNLRFGQQCLCSSHDAITIIALGEPPSSWWCVPDRLLPRLDPIHWPSCPCQTQALQSLPPSHHSLPQLSQHHILGVNEKSLFSDNDNFSIIFLASLVSISILIIPSNHQLKV